MLLWSMAMSYATGLATEGRQSCGANQSVTFLQNSLTNGILFKSDSILLQTLNVL